MLKYIFCFLVGAGCGAVGSYLYFKEKFQKDADMRIESMKAYLTDKKIEDHQYVEEPETEETEDETDIPKQPAELVVERNPVRTAYSSFYEQPKEEDHPEDDQDTISLAESTAEYFDQYFNSDPPIIRIEEDDLGELGDACPEDLIIFWPLNGVYTNDNYEVFDDPSIYLGDDYRSMFTPDDSDEPDIFIRNKRVQKDFRVQKMTGWMNAEVFTRYDGEAEIRVK